MNAENDMRELLNRNDLTIREMVYKFTKIRRDSGRDNNEFRYIIDIIKYESELADRNFQSMMALFKRKLANDTWNEFVNSLYLEFEGHPEPQ